MLPKTTPDLFKRRNNHLYGSNFGKLLNKINNFTQLPFDLTIYVKGFSRANSELSDIQNE